MGHTMNLAELPGPLLIVSAAMLGLIIGSFLNVVILRLPKMLQADWDWACRAHLHPDAAETGTTTRFNLVTPVSHCPACGYRIRPWENIPLLSWLLLRGRCSHCATAISARYPLVEALTGLLSALAVWHFGPSAQALAALILIWSLISLGFIDLDHQLLPDDITLPLLWLGLLIAIEGLFIPLQDAVLGAVAGYGAFWLVFHTFRLLTGKEGLGHGDFKLFAALGAWMGWQALPMIALLASVAGLILAVPALCTGRIRTDTPIPFGPFLAMGGWITLMWGEWMRRMIGLGG